jgi:hypothetical protein
MPTELDASPETSDSGSQSQDSPPPDRDRPEVSAETSDSGSQSQESPPPDGDRPDVRGGDGDHPTMPGNPEVGLEPFDPRGPKASDYEGPHFGHLGPDLPPPRKDIPTGERAIEGSKRVAVETSTRERPIRDISTGIPHDISPGIQVRIPRSSGEERG